MSRQTATIPLFSKGLNTEISDITDLPLYTKDEDNCVIFSDGSRGRRLGFNYERGYDLVEETAVSNIPTGEVGEVFKPLAIQTFEWENYKGDGDTVLVVQVGTKIIFLKGIQRGVLSRDQSSYTIDLKEYKVEGVEDSDLGFTKASMTSAYGVLFISTPKTEVISVKFTESYEFLAQYPGTGNLHRGGMDTGRYGSFGIQGSTITFELEDGRTQTQNLFYGNHYGSTNPAYSMRDPSTLPRVVNALPEEYRFGITATEGDVFNTTFTTPLGAEYNNAKVTLLLHLFVYNRSSKYKTFRWSTTLTGAHDATISVDGGLEVEVVTPKIRDTKGLEDNVANDKCPPDLSKEHEYNLYNQGWNTAERDAFKDNTNTYPSNAMQWFVGKGSNGSFAPQTLLSYAFGTSQAPRGRVIMNAYTHDRSTQSGVAEIPTNRFFLHRPEDINFYAGRLWYAYDDTVLYSQILAEDCTLADRCYQAADPTSEDISDPVDTDGGHMQIQECGNILRIVTLGSAVIFLGTKGVVTLQPGDNAGFTPTSYIKTVVSSVGVVGKWAVAEAGNAVVVWNHLGIFALGFVNNSLAMQPLSEGTIQSLIKDIPDWAVENAVIEFNQIKNEVVFLYPSSEANVKRLDRILFYNISQNTWTRASVSSEGRAVPYILDAVKVKNPINTQPLSVVTVGGDDVTAEEEFVTIEKDTDDWVGFDSVSYVVLDTYSGNLTFANMTDVEHRDWSSGDREGNGYSYESYLISHPIVNAGQQVAARTLPSAEYNKAGVKVSSAFLQKQAPYVTNIFKSTEEDTVFASGCFMSARWDWALAENSFKWTQKQQVYRPSNLSLYEEFVITKTRLRGSGRALQLKYENEGDKDFRLCAFGLDMRGWSK